MLLPDRSRRSVPSFPRNVLCRWILPVRPELRQSGLQDQLLQVEEDLRALEGRGGRSRAPDTLRPSYLQSAARTPGSAPSPLDPQGEQALGGPGPPHCLRRLQPLWKSALPGDHYSAGLLQNGLHGALRLRRQPLEPAKREGRRFPPWSSPLSSIFTGSRGNRRERPRPLAGERRYPW